MSAQEAEAFKAFEAEGWSAQAESYGGLLGRSPVDLPSRCSMPLASVRISVCSTRATGPGYVAECAAARRARVVGIDFADGMLTLAHRRLGDIQLLRADAEELPFEDACFDAVVGGFVVNHLPHPQRALAEAARVLVSGGRAVEPYRVSGEALELPVAAKVASGAKP